ncbi:unnamed protein product, partial [Brachionus calyciflorus]
VLTTQPAFVTIFCDIERNNSDCSLNLNQTDSLFLTESFLIDSNTIFGSFNAFKIPSKNNKTCVPFFYGQTSYDQCASINGSYLCKTREETFDECGKSKFIAAKAPDNGSVFTETFSFKIPVKFKGNFELSFHSIILCNNTEVCSKAGDFFKIRIQVASKLLKKMKENIDEIKFDFYQEKKWKEKSYSILIDEVGAEINIEIMMGRQYDNPNIAYFGFDNLILKNISPSTKSSYFLPILIGVTIPG